MPRRKVAPKPPAGPTHVDAAPVATGAAAVSASTGGAALSVGHQVKSLGLPKTRTKAQKKQTKQDGYKGIGGARQFAQGGSEDVSSGNDILRLSTSSDDNKVRVRNVVVGKSMLKLQYDVVSGPYARDGRGGVGLLHSGGPRQRRLPEQRQGGARR